MDSFSSMVSFLTGLVELCLRKHPPTSRLKDTIKADQTYSRRLGQNSQQGKYKPDLFEHDEWDT